MLLTVTLSGTQRDVIDQGHHPHVGPVLTRLGPHPTPSSRVFVALHRLSLGEQGCAVCGLLLLWSPGSGAQLQQLWPMGLAAL